MRKRNLSWGLVIGAVLLLVIGAGAGAQGYPAPSPRPTSTTIGVITITLPDDAAVIGPAETITFELDVPPTALPGTGGETENPFTGMDLAQALLFATTTAGAGVVLGIAYSFIVQVFPQFTKLETWQKIGALAGLSLGIPVGATLLRGALGYTEVTAVGLGEAVWAGVVAFGLSQVTHNLRKALTSDSTEDIIARLIVDTATELQEYDRAKIQALIEQISELQDDGLGAVVSEVLRTILTYLDTLELRKAA